MKMFRAAGVLPLLALISAGSTQGQTFSTVQLNVNNLSSYTSTTGSGGAYIYFETTAWLYDSGSGTTWANGGATTGTATTGNSAFIATIGNTPITMNWNGLTGNSALYFSDPINVNTLTDGITVSYAAASRMYVSLGSTFAVTGSGAILGNGSGSYAAGAPNPTSTADPNYNVRWDVFEVTYEGGTNASDQMDLTAINMTAVPMRLQNYTGTALSGNTGRTLRQTGETAPTTGPTNDYNALQTALVNLANTGTGNNATLWGGLPANWTIVGSNTGGTASAGSEFLRTVGPNAGSTIGTSSTTVSGTMFMGPATGTNGQMNTEAQAVIGPYKDFSTYIDYVQTNAIATTVSGTITIGSSTYGWSGTLNATPFTGGTYSADWTLGTTPVSGTMVYADSNAIQWSSTITTNGTASGVLKLLIPEAGDVYNDTDAFTNFLRSKVIYDGAVATYGPTWVWTTTAGVSTTYFDFNAVNGLLGGDMLKIQSQILHDLTCAFAFGLIGNTNTINGTSLNDMGSAGWRDLENSGSFFDFLTGSFAGTFGFLNEWAQVVYQSSDTIYGMVYSDFFQPVLLQSSNINGDTVTSWDLTILADSVPEVGTLSLVATGLGALWMLRRKKAAQR